MLKLVKGDLFMRCKNMVSALSPDFKNTFYILLHQGYGNFLKSCCKGFLLLSQFVSTNSFRRLKLCLISFFIFSESAVNFRGAEYVTPTSSSLYVIMVKALKTLSVEPVMVMILSGQEPSEMLTRAQLCKATSRDHITLKVIKPIRKKIFTFLSCLE